MKNIIALALLGLAYCSPAAAGDVDTVFACISEVAPESLQDGAPPPPNPQTCIGMIAKLCTEAGGDVLKCNARETKAWLGAIASVQTNAKENYGKKQSAAFKAGTSTLLQNAIALCRASAATSAWGSDSIAEGKDPTIFDGSHPCVRESVAQQALIVLTQRMGI
jgi:hypothetical protein